MVFYSKQIILSLFSDQTLHKALITHERDISLVMLKKMMKKVKFLNLWTLDVSRS